MSISSIQPSSTQYHIFEVNRASSPADEKYGTRNTGSDTVSFSEESIKKARELITGKTETEKDERAFLKGTEADENDGKPESLSQSFKKSYFGMLLESLFMAELEESGAIGNGGQNGAEGSPQEGVQKSSNPLTDGEKVAELKQLMKDLSNGKADISDIPAAMAGGSSGKGAGKPSDAGKAASPNSDDSSATA